MRGDLVGGLRYLLARLNPFSDYTWARHRASGLRYRVSVRDAVGRQILRHQGYELGLTRWLMDQLEAAGPDALFVDIGANLGWYALQAACRDSVGLVLALEPDLDNQQLLRTNVARNGLGNKVTVVGCAAGAGPGLAPLHGYKSSNRGRHSLAIDHGMGSAMVCVEALDTLLTRLGLGTRAIGAIKIDVEGFEPEVLRGALHALPRTSALLVELSPELSGPAGHDLDGMLDCLAASGFRPVAWDQPGPLDGFDALRARVSQATVGFERLA